MRGPQNTGHASVEPRLAEIERQIADLERRRARLRQMLIDGVAPPTMSDIED